MTTFEYTSDSLHQLRTLSGIRPTRPSLTEARSGLTEHERRAMHDRVNRDLHETKPKMSWAEVKKLKAKIAKVAGVDSSDVMANMSFDRLTQLEVGGLSTTSSGRPDEGGHRLRTVAAHLKKAFPKMDVMTDRGRVFLTPKGAMGEAKRSLKDQHADALKRAKDYPKSGWRKHAAKIKKKMGMKEDEDLTESSEVIDALAKLITKSKHNFIDKIKFDDPAHVKEAESVLRSRARLLARGEKVGLKQQREIVRKAMEKADPSLAKKFYAALGSYKAPKRVKRPTFQAAKAAILQHLDKKGWTVKARLKVPHATDPHKGYRLYFKSQAVYLGGAHPGASLGDARSLHTDIRDVTPEQFMAQLERSMKEDLDEGSKGIDFMQDGVKYHATVMDLRTPKGREIYFVQPYGKRGKLLKKHRPATRAPDGTFTLRGRWLAI